MVCSEDHGINNNCFGHQGLVILAQSVMFAGFGVRRSEVQMVWRATHCERPNYLCCAKSK